MRTQRAEEQGQPGLEELLHGHEDLLQPLQAQQRDTLPLFFLSRLLHGGGDGRVPPEKDPERGREAFLKSAPLRCSVRPVKPHPADAPPHEFYQT